MYITVKDFIIALKSSVKDFIIASKSVVKGGPAYYLWVCFLLVVILIGAVAYSFQWEYGLLVTNMRDQVSWGFYISNFTFLVGVAAAAVLLIIPAYIYDFKPIKEIAFLGEIIAISAITMCMLFVTADLGKPLMVWHLLPIVGTPNWPRSLLSWDILVLNTYLAINVFILFYVLYKIHHGKPYKEILPLIMLSIPLAISIHTVTAFLYNGLSARPFWNASILAPRFIASAFCSGPALMIILFQVVRKNTKVKIEDKAIFKIAELIAYTLAINLFLLACEVFKEFYSQSIHLAPLEYLYFGLLDSSHVYHGQLVSWMWLALSLNTMALIFFLIPKTRKNLLTLNIGCAFVFIGVYIEKGMGLIIPGFIPGTLGEIYEYIPTRVEVAVAMGIWATGALIFTLLLKFSIPLLEQDRRQIQVALGTVKH